MELDSLSSGTLWLSDWKDYFTQRAMNCLARLAPWGLDVSNPELAQSWVLQMVPVDGDNWPPSLRRRPEGVLWKCCCWPYSLRPASVALCCWMQNRWRMVNSPRWTDVFAFPYLFHRRFQSGSFWLFPLGEKGIYLSWFQQRQYHSPKDEPLSGILRLLCQENYSVSFTSQRWEVPWGLSIIFTCTC